MKLAGKNVDDIPPMQRMAFIRQGEGLLAGRKGDPDLHFQLGVLYKKDGQMDNALRHLNIALKANKKNPNIVGHVADAYVGMWDFQSAKKYVRRMVELQPRELEILRYQADFLEKAGLFKQALEAWQNIDRLFPNSADNLQNLAACLRILGRWDEVEATYHKILAIDPYHAQTLYLVANSNKHEADAATELLKAIEVAIDKEADPVETANLHYAAGKLNTEISDHDAAMAHYAKANAYREPRKESEDPFHAFKTIPKAFVRSAIKRLATFGNTTRAPVFILGMPRSGTTLVESRLGGHSSIKACGELGQIGSFASRLGIARAEPNALVQLIQRWDTGDVSSFADEYLASVSGFTSDHPHFTDKMPHNFLHVGLIKMLFPNATIIHCRRHPIDNCLSLYTNSMTDFHNGYKSNLKTLGLYYRQYLNLMAHWRAELPGEMHEIFYEDVVANTELNARAMISHVGLEWEDNVLKRENSQSAVKTLSVWQVRQPIYTSSAGRWKKFEKHLGPLIDALGGCVEAYETELQNLAKDGKP